MRKEAATKVTKTILKELRGASARERVLHRLHVVVLVLNGLSAVEAGTIYGDSARAVAYWVTRFKHSGVQGLEEESGRGRPSKLTEDQLKHLQTFVEKERDQSRTVNADAVSSYLLKTFRVRLTPRQCWRILKRL
jgi:transposase